MVSLSNYSFSGVTLGKHPGQGGGRGDHSDGGYRLFRAGGNAPERALLVPETQ
jgi:hypothetical protein